MTGHHNTTLPTGDPAIAALTHAIAFLADATAATATRAATTGASKWSALLADLAAVQYAAAALVPDQLELDPDLDVGGDARESDPEVAVRRAQESLIRFPAGQYPAGTQSVLEQLQALSGDYWP